VNSGWPTTEPRDRSPGALVELARRVRGLLARDDEAVAIREACQAARITVRRHALEVARDRHTAMLVPTDEGFTALVDSKLWDRASSGEAARRHLRFVLAHELGHTFFYRSGSPPSRTVAPSGAEERFCDAFATFLLVPSAVAARTSLDPAGLHGLAERFDVSRRVAAWAMARSRPGTSILEFRRAQHPGGGREAMRLRWGASQHFLAPGESLKSNLAELAPGEHRSCSQRLRLGGRDRELDLEAWRQASALLVFAQHREPGTVPGQWASPLSHGAHAPALTLFP
jgi:hypothetical protein